MNKNDNGFSMQDANKIVLSIRDVSKSFTQGKMVLHVLQSASLDLQQGEMVAMVGPSGAGKTTFLQIAGLLDKGNSGEVIVDGVSCMQAADSVRTHIRGEKIGFVYQMHHLLAEFSALENVMLPQMLLGKTKKNALVKAQEVLGLLGLENRLRHRPAELSGGEQQRVAIARAIVNDPSVLLADEPTGNLDSATSEQVLELLLQVIQEKQIAALIVTHNMALAKRMDKVVTLQQGNVIPSFLSKPES